MKKLYLLILLFVALGGNAQDSTKRNIIVFDTLGFQCVDIFALLRTVHDTLPDSLIVSIGHFGDKYGVQKIKRHPYSVTFMKKGIFYQASYADNGILVECNCIGGSIRHNTKMYYEYGYVYMSKKIHLSGGFKTEQYFYPNGSVHKEENYLVSRYSEPYKHGRFIEYGPYGNIVLQIHYKYNRIIG